MTRDDIIRIAEQNGLIIAGEAMFHFVALVAAAEREACLEVVKEYLTAARSDPRRHLGLGDIRLTIGDEHQISEAIRARGTGKEYLPVAEEQEIGARGDT